MGCKPNFIVVEQLPETLGLPVNSIGSMLNRRIGRSWEGYVPIVLGAGSHAINVFKVTGTVLVTNQIAIITDDTDIADCTNVYASFHDGTVDNDLTLPGIDLSGVPVGTTFFKDKDETQTYTLLSAADGQVYEPTNWKEGKPFYCVAKIGASNYIQFHLTTASAVNFTMWLEFEFKLINGAKLELA